MVAKGLCRFKSGRLQTELAVVGILLGFHVNSGEASAPMEYLEFRFRVVEELPQGCGRFVFAAPGCAKETYATAQTILISHHSSFHSVFHYPIITP